MKEIIGYISLDDRPCNYSWPAKLLKNAQDFQLLTPPREIMGRFEVPADREKIYTWLRENVSSMNGLILSMDLLAYGGLVASRRLGDNLSQIMDKVRIVEELKTINPNLVIYAFSVLMRISITVDSLESHKNWKYIFEYSKVHYQINQLKQTELCEKLKNLEDLIDPKILSDYLETRKRNFALNKSFLDLVDKGLLDFLVYCQEDAAEYGFHREEQAELRKLIRKRDLLEKVEVITGTDELGSMLLARYINDTLERTPRVFVDYTFDEGRYIIAPYEDCCLDISVGEHIRIIGAMQGAEPDNSDFIFLCHNSSENPLDLYSFNPREFSEDASKIFQKKFKKYLKDEKPIAVADVFYSNGGDPALVSALISKKLLKFISSYSAMNTTSNSIGISLAQASLCLSLNMEKKYIQKLLLEKIMDDCYYQTIVRPEINNKISLAGLTPINLGKNALPFEAEIEKRLSEYLNKIVSKEKIPLNKFRAWLPWGRTFEVEMELEIDEI